MTIPRQDAYRFTAAATCSRKKEEIIIDLAGAGLTRPAAQRLVEEMVRIRQERGAAGAPVSEEELLKAGSGQGTPLAFVADPRPRRRRPLDLHVRFFVRAAAAALSLTALSFLGITLPLWVEAIIAGTAGSLAVPLYEAVRPWTGSEIAEAKQQDRAEAFLEHLGEKRLPQGPPKGYAAEQRRAQEGETSFDWKDLSG